MEQYSTEIGTIHGQFDGQTIRVKAVYNTYKSESPVGVGICRGSLIGFELDHFATVRNDKGEDIPIKVSVTRSVVDRLCGMMMSELQAHERREADDRIRRER